MPSERRRIIRHIVKSAQQGTPSRKAIRHWNTLPDQKRFGANPTKLRRNLNTALPDRFNVEEDLTIGIPRHKHRKRSPEKEALWDNKPPYPA